MNALSPGEPSGERGAGPAEDGGDPDTAGHPGIVPVPSLECASKAEARRRLRTSRSQLAEDLNRRRARALARVLRSVVHPAHTVLAYLPMAGEPDVLPFLESHSGGGGRVVVPIIPDPPSRTLLWADWSPDVLLRPSPRFPVREPVGPRLQLFDVLEHGCSREARNGEGLGAEGRAGSAGTTILVPGLAIDSRGYRLGQGGGYYDSTLAQCGLAETSAASSVQAIGIVHPEEFLDAGAFPVEDHDLRVGTVATSAGLAQV